MDTREADPGDPPDFVVRMARIWSSVLGAVFLLFGALALASGDGGPMLSLALISVAIGLFALARFAPARVAVLLVLIGF